MLRAGILESGQDDNKNGNSKFASTWLYVTMKALKNNNELHKNALKSDSGKGS